MRLGIPGGLLYYRYEPFIRTFFNELGVETEFSVFSNREILDLGIRNCVDEACFPMKLFHGHAAKLSRTCDRIAVPRIMTCEFGESICPKFRGLPELISGGTGKNMLAFTEPAYLDHQTMLLKALKRGSREIGISDHKTEKAFRCGLENQRNTSRGLNETGYRYRVFLAGHPYNIYDSYANLDLIRKLHRLDIGVVTEEYAARSDLLPELGAMMKRPYWFFLIHNFAPALVMMKRGEIGGIVYVSSFNCGTDSITIELIRNRIGDFPFLVLKLDEQSGEAGYDTRLEAFREVLP